MVLRSRKEKERRVIQLAKEGKATRQLAKTVHISLMDIDIGKSIAKETGHYDIVKRGKTKAGIRKREKNRWKSIQSYSKEFQMSKEK